MRVHLNRSSILEASTSYHYFSLKTERTRRLLHSIEGPPCALSLVEFLRSDNALFGCIT